MSDHRNLLDVNVLLALSISSHVHHHAAHRALSAMTAWATCSVTETALLRLLLNPSMTGSAFTAPDVVGVLTGMHRDPRWFLVPDSVSPVTSRLDLTVLVGHRQVTDFHLVDLAAREGLVLATFDARLAAGLAPQDRGHVRLLEQ